MELEESQKPNQLHFLVIPLGSPGHYIPTIDIARLLSQHGVNVTIVTTPVSTRRFGSILDPAIQSGLPITFLEFPFPYNEFGLPQGCEAIDELPDITMGKQLFAAYSSLQNHVEKYIQSHQTMATRPSCIIADSILLWVNETAKKFGIPRVIFDGMNCFTQMCNHVLYISKVHETVGENESFVLPGLPDCIELTKSQLSFAFNPGSNHSDFHEKLRVSESEAYGVVVNSFRELEKEYADEFQRVKGDKVFCIGPLPLALGYSDSEKVQRGNKSSINEKECLTWLNSHENGSVIYACLGSISRVEPAQLAELALGLESSKKPFIWVVRAGHKTDKIEKWIDENGFEKRTKSRALLIRGWAPQLLILSHPAIGGFLTHCGWNSTLEGVSAGVPMVTWPQFQEQFYNEKLVVQVLRIGVSVGAQNVVHLGEEEKSRVVVKSDAFKKAIYAVMEDGEEKRNRAKELGNMAYKAVQVGGSSYGNVTRLIEDIRAQASTRMCR